MAEPVCTVNRQAWRAGDFFAGVRVIPEETAVAFTYDGSSFAVMMATPQDLEDFAVGFSLNEGIVGMPSEIERLAILEEEAGIELRMTLAGARAEVLKQRRRFLAGPVGCGLCGIESLQEATRPLPRVPAGARVTPEAILRAVEAIGAAQALGERTRAVHAAALCAADGGLIALREDVGRHNALDKLAGVLARSGQLATNGMIVLTSRLSVELVQKAAAMAAPILVAVSAPTALAVRSAETAGITLAAVARRDGFEVFTHGERIATLADV